ncbi:MAG: 4Fe-4S dicluster domain-containing protein [Acidimicrobiaceae bacterium]|nr:4Fe-4S dicluster domain-containing protein [Acidimicrobiaceae bacterium]
MRKQYEKEALVRHPKASPDESVAAVTISRRGLLRAAALGGIGVGVLGVMTESLAAASQPATTTPTGPIKQWCMVIDLRLCNGCKLCTTACQTAHYLHEDQTWMNVYTMQNAAGEDYFMPRPCMMCEDPACVPVCPVGANFRTPEGLTLVDQSKCIGTRICMNACPYDARYFNWSEAIPAPRQPFKQEPEWPVPQVKGTVGKCIECAAMLPSGQLPECATNCPMGVIYFGDLTSDVAVDGMGNTIKISTYLADNDAVVFKEEYGTHPRVYYIPGHGQDLNNNSSAS